MSKNLKAPPPFDPDEDNYEQFKKDLQIWEILTELDVKKKGPAVYLSLNKKARDAVRNLSVADISDNDGLKKIIQRLDDVYHADKNTRAYTAFQNFYKCKRESGETYEQFIVKFERLYGELIAHDMTLPEGIRAFFVLNAANLPDDMEKLARATTDDLTYKNMKIQIKKICGTTVGSGEDESAPPLKDEVLFGYGRNRGRSNNRYNRGGRGRGSYQDQGNTRNSTTRSSAYSQDRRKTDEARNPVNSHGLQMRCYGCDSQTHFFKDCPKNKKSEVQEINIVLLNAVPDDKQKSLVIESLGKGVLDCGCTRTVAGEFWMREFLTTLSPQDSKLVKREQSNSMFRFGDGGECKSMRRMIIPIQIGTKNYFLRVEVVENEIPLLLSKSTMKGLGKSQSNLDLKSDKWIIDDEEISLHCTESGHYCIPVNVFQTDSCNITLRVRELQNLSREDKMSKALKLHRQFGHASQEKLLRLISKSSVNDAEFNRCVKDVCINCTICQKYKPPPLKPTVSLPLATEFNQVVCLDLKEYIHNKVWILHMIDASTRYSAARLITTKRKEEIAKKLFEMWISYFGKPGTLMSDNGGEFSNELYTELSQKLGIRMIMPPAESPFSNGIVERHNKILFETMMKTKEDARCEPEVALAWACSAKNALQNNGGFSPNQLVFGHNVNMPTVLTDDLPALEPTTSSDIVRKHLQAIHSARKNYIEAENSDRIRRALKHKTRVYSEVDYESGEKVYFKRRAQKNWIGPGTVIGFDGYTVLVKLGGSVFKCHRCHVMKVINTPSVKDSQTDQREIVCKQASTYDSHRNKSSTSPRVVADMWEDSDSDDSFFENNATNHHDQEDGTNGNLEHALMQLDESDGEVQYEEEIIDANVTEEGEILQQTHDDMEHEMRQILGDENILAMNNNADANDESETQQNEDGSIDANDDGMEHEMTQLLGDETILAMNNNADANDESETQQNTDDENSLHIIHNHSNHSSPKTSKLHLVSGEVGQNTLRGAGECRQGMGVTVCRRTMCRQVLRTRVRRK